MVAALVASGHGLGIFAGPVVDGLGSVRDINVHLGFDRTAAQYPCDLEPVQTMAEKSPALGKTITRVGWGHH